MALEKRNFSGLITFLLRDYITAFIGLVRKPSLQRKLSKKKYGAILERLKGVKEKFNILKEYEADKDMKYALL